MSCMSRAMYVSHVLVLCLTFICGFCQRRRHIKSNMGIWNTSRHWPLSMIHAIKPKRFHWPTPFRLSFFFQFVNSNVIMHAPTCQQTQKNNDCTLSSEMSSQPNCDSFCAIMLFWFPCTNSVDHFFLHTIQIRAVSSGQTSIDIDFILNLLFQPLTKTFGFVRR